MKRINLRVGIVLCALIRQAAPSLTKVTPIVAEADTTFPFAAYQRTGTAYGDTKDRLLGIFRASYDITIRTADYESGLHIAEDVASLIHRYAGVMCGFSISDIAVESIDEDYFEDAYSQTLHITIGYTPVGDPAPIQYN